MKRLALDPGEHGRQHRLRRCVAGHRDDHVPTAGRVLSVAAAASGRVRFYHGEPEESAEPVLLERHPLDPNIYATNNRGRTKLRATSNSITRTKKLLTRPKLHQELKLSLNYLHFFIYHPRTLN